VRIFEFTKKDITVPLEFSLRSLGWNAVKLDTLAVSSHTS
jgi:hypothetical protein